MWQEEAMGDVPWYGYDESQPVCVSLALDTCKNMPLFTRLWAS